MIFLFSLLITCTSAIKFLTLGTSKDKNTDLALFQIEVENDFQMHKISNLLSLGYCVSSCFNGTVMTLIVYEKDFKQFSIRIVTKRGHITNVGFAMKTLLHDIFQDGYSLFAIGMNPKTHNVALVKINLIHKNISIKYDYGWKYIERGATYDYFEHVYYLAYNTNNYESFIVSVNTSNYKTITYGPLSLYNHYTFFLMITSSGKLILANIMNVNITKIQLILLDLNTNKTQVLVTYSEFNNIQMSILGKNNNIVYSIFVGNNREYYYVMTDCIAKTYTFTKIEGNYYPQFMWEI